MLSHRNLEKGQAIVDANIFLSTGYEYVTKLCSHDSPCISCVPGRPIVLMTEMMHCLGFGHWKLSTLCGISYDSFLNCLGDTGWLARKANMVVRHSEDEIAVIIRNWRLIYRRPLRCRHIRGGFALMVEGLSLAGVLNRHSSFLSQRPGPATGMPTWTEQGDLLFAFHAGHGEFPKIILAPDIEEMVN
jgi:2-oxoglutarate ferredoxin oxidoreductase subunit alpha